MDRCARVRAMAAALAVLAICGCQRPIAGQLRDEPWTAYGRTADEQRHSPLTQIDGQTISGLGLAWSVDLPPRARTLQATPLMVDGVLYFTTALSEVYALDAVTGAQKWHYDPEVGKRNGRGLRTIQGMNRGVAYGDGLIVFGALDGRLIALDAKTGQERWTKDTIEEKDSRKLITGAPRIFKGKVIIGNSGADFGTRGYVTTYDLQSGRKLWRFYTVPGDPRKGFEDAAMEMAAKTWTGEWYKWGGGGTVWNGITYDPELNRIYIGVGNSSIYNPAIRSPAGGDNLFLASIVALDANTGKYIWHYQVNPREAWDYKATADMVLTDLTINNARHKVLMQAPTNGFFYVIDRVTGKLLSAEKLGKVTWAERIDLKTGRPVERPGIRYENGGPVTIYPSPYGTHNWQAMSYSPELRTVFIPTMEGGAMTLSVTDEDKRLVANQVIGSKNYLFASGVSMRVEAKDPEDGTGSLVAWDPVAQKARWTVRHRTLYNGGTLVTAANLVFQGTADGWLRAFAARDGKELWKFYANQGIIAPPITYSVGGVQYLTVLAGYGGTSPVAGWMGDAGWRYGKHMPRVLTFRLGGAAKLAPMPPPDFSTRLIDDPKLPIDERVAKAGEGLWNRSCVMCHGPAAATGGATAPDLRESVVAHDLDGLKAVLRDGALVENGMPQYDEFSDAQIRSLQMYIRQVSRFPIKRPAGSGF
jgi:quinohemoprotein ethanol dehydrogenase